jgi:hypothetical protein
MATFVWALATALINVVAPAPSAAERRDDVVTYFLFPYQGSVKQSHQWRLFDPVTNRDTLFLSLPGGFDGVRWDSMLDRVWFSSGDSLYTVEWRLGAIPRLISRLPAGQREWWFDPVTDGWQALRTYESSDKSDPDIDLYNGELWQRPRRDTMWRRVRTGPVCWIRGTDDEHWEWANGDYVGRDTGVVMLADLASDAWKCAWSAKTACFDTSTFIVTPDDGRPRSDGQWNYLPLRAHPRKGIAFERSGPLVPEHQWMGVLAPFYLVDLDDRSKKDLTDGGHGILRSLVAERNGFLLSPGVGNLRVFDTTGNRVCSTPWNSEGAVWVRRPSNWKR